jgi:hypothetical protein
VSLNYWQELPNEWTPKNLRPKRRRIKTTPRDGLQAHLPNLGRASGFASVSGAAAFAEQKTCRCDQGCQIFLYLIYQKGGRYTKLPLIYQMAREYNNFFLIPSSSIYLLKLGFLVWRHRYHLATLVVNQASLLLFLKYFRQINWKKFLRFRHFMPKNLAPWDSCYDFKDIFAKKWAFSAQNKAKYCKILIISLVFEKSVNFIPRKFSKNAENCDHNIDPWLAHLAARPAAASSASRSSRRSASRCWTTSSASQSGPGTDVLSLKLLKNDKLKYYSILQKQMDKHRFFKKDANFLLKIAKIAETSKSLS